MSDDSSHSSEDSGASWITSFCQEPQNQFFCEVERSFIEDGFNLYGLRPFVKHFKESLDIILDNKSHADDDGVDQEEYQENAEMLYGLIHARYIITMHGMETMCQKFERKEFGECPRMMCGGQAVVPVGTKDEPHQDSVRIFCPKCQQVYNPPPVHGGGGRRARQFSSASSSGSSSASSGSSSGAIRMDSAYIGTTFPHLFFMTFEEKVPQPARDIYVPRVFGFKLHASNKSRVTPTLLPAPTPPPTAAALASKKSAAAAKGGGDGTETGGGSKKTLMVMSSDDDKAVAAAPKRRRTEER